MNWKLLSPCSSASPDALLTTYAYPAYYGYPIPLYNFTSQQIEFFNTLFNFLYFIFFSIFYLFYHSRLQADKSLTSVLCCHVNLVGRGYYTMYLCTGPRSSTDWCITVAASSAGQGERGREEAHTHVSTGPSQTPS